ncbi:hypothetical protein E2C01_099095 [Portunus trituberculatus]|uniref:Uncharacterized protein n=1 Tax=Portunus trituberculatus TaxID=210409 RepID=A0A5B7KFW9_PORTR|nr:hypothetical protein [Portunus trituberculatus]
MESTKNNCQQHYCCKASVTTFPSPKFPIRILLSLLSR